jgi:hypothetical protein
VRGRRGDGGQATVELALVLPVVALLALLVAQVAVVAHRQVLVVHAAREAARSAAVAGSGAEVPDAARRGADLAGGLPRERLGVQATLVGDRVEVVVTFDDPTDVAVVGPLLPDVTLRATATMRWEGE